MKRTLARVGFSAALILTLTLGQGAARANNLQAGGGAVLALSPLTGLHKVQATLNAEVLPLGLGQVLIVFNCKAVAIPDPASTGVTVCSVDGQDALLLPVDLPGAVAATAGFVIASADGTHRGCVRGHAQFVEDVVGPSSVSTATKCGDLITAGA